MTDQTLAQGAGPMIDPMELEAILVEVLDALIMNAGMDPEAPIPAEAGIEATPLHGTILVNANTTARLVIATDAQVCATLARCWGLVGEDGATGQDVADALGELCNLVGATAKTVFEEESHVGIPEVADGPAPEWGAEVVEIVHLTGRFTAQFGPDES